MLPNAIDRTTLGLRATLPRTMAKRRDNSVPTTIAELLLDDYNLFYVQPLNATGGRFPLEIIFLRPTAMSAFYNSL